MEDMPKKRRRKTNPYIKFVTRPVLEQLDETCLAPRKSPVEENTEREQDDVVQK